MHRLTIAIATTLLATGALRSALAGEDPALRREVDSLRQRAEALESGRDSLLESEIARYLEGSEAWSEAQGGAEGIWGRLTINATVTAVLLSTAGGEANTHAGTGSVQVDFIFKATQNLTLFAKINGNQNGSAFDAALGIERGGAPATLSGLTDGIGIDGTVVPSGTPIGIYEAGFICQIPIKDQTLHIKAGQIDPRNDFAQNAFAGDNKTQFLNNVFSDPPAISWPNSASTPCVGGQLWMLFGDSEEWRVDIGLYNSAGEVFSGPVFMWQGSWRTEVQGRELNVRLYGAVDAGPTDYSPSIGVTSDWWATEKIGVFARFTVHHNRHPSTGETNHIESDWSVGAQGKGLVGSRPDDTCGIAWALIKGPVSEAGVIPGAPKNHENVVELYYRFMLEKGKLQVSPLVQFLIDPGAGAFLDDSLVVFGLRVHATF